MPVGYVKDGYSKTFLGSILEVVRLIFILLFSVLTIRNGKESIWDLLIKVLMAMNLNGWSLLAKYTSCMYLMENIRLIISYLNNHLDNFSLLKYLILIKLKLLNYLN